MEKETEEKYFGRGNELAYQLFEMFLNNADLYSKQNRLLEHVTEVKTKYNNLLQKHKEFEQPQQKPGFFRKIFSSSSPAKPGPTSPRNPESPRKSPS